MAYSSVDFTTMMPRTVEAARLQGHEVSQTQHAAEQTAVQFQEKVQQEAQQTVETNKSDMEREGGSGKGGGGSRRGKKKQEEKKAPMAPRSNSSFDITI